MKKLLILILVTSTAFTFGQNEVSRSKQKERVSEKRMKMSAEDMATLRVKKMTLNLDLSEDQQKKIYPLVLEQTNKFKEERQNRDAEIKNTKRQNLSSEERVEREKARLDEKIAFKAKMKEILTPEQYKKFDHKYTSKARKSHKAKMKRKE